MSCPTAPQNSMPACDKVNDSGCVLNALLQATDQMLVYLDSAFNFVWVNNAYAEGCGRKTEDLVGKNHFALYPHPENEHIFQQVRDTGEAIFFKDKPFEFPDQPERGTTYWDWKLTPIKDGAGKVSGLVFSLRETTKQVLAESALRESEIRFRTLFDEAPVAIFVHNPENGALVQANRRAMDSYGYSKLEELQQADLFGDPAFSEQDALKLIRQTVDTGPQRFEWRSVDRHGKVFWEDMLLTPVRFDGAPRVLAMATDISERKQAEAALREADQRKDEFLAMLAHELRNPLAPIRNAASVLGLLNLDEPRVRWAQAIIERQVTHLTRLVDELLDVSRIARGKVTLHKAPIMLADLLRQVGESVQPVMAEKSHQFEMQSPAERVVLEGDIVRLVQVLQNLLNNAAKFTPEGGHIKLEARLQGEEIEIEVRDNGTGISADLLPGVFDLFRQGERTLDRSQSGLGIGLTLVQRLVEMHDGRVEAHSDGAGLGARFTVWLPVSRLEPANLTTTGEPAAIPSGLKILVVDDNPIVLESLVMLLELQGCQVRSAASGNTALKVLDVFWPQIVLLDIGMPEQDGYEVARQLRRLPGGEQLKLVAVSGYGHQEALTESQQAGFDTHLVKPYAANTLNLLLNRLCNQT